MERAPFQENDKNLDNFAVLPKFYDKFFITRRRQEWDGAGMSCHETKQTLGHQLKKGADGVWTLAGRCKN